MSEDEIRALFTPVLKEITSDCSVAESFVDKEQYQINLATVWANVVLKPHDAGLSEKDLETVYGVFNGHIEEVLGKDRSLNSCFEFINSRPGDKAMQRYQLTKMHKDMLLYFCSMILDPEGHKRWIKENA